jgi:hypothetical protein
MNGLRGGMSVSEDAQDQGAQGSQHLQGDNSMRRFAAAAVIATGLITSGGLALSTPASASTCSVSAKPSAGSGTINQKLGVTGAVAAGCHASTMLLQYASAGRWYTATYTHPNSVRNYVMSFTRANYGAVSYRVAARTSAGTVTGASAAFTIRWFAWLRIGTSSTATWSTCSGSWCGTDATFSFNGKSYPDSGAMSGYESHPDTMQEDVHLKGFCRYVRYVGGWAAGANSSDTGAIQIVEDGNAVRTDTITPAQPTPVSAGASSHDLISFLLTGTYYAASSGNSSYAVIGTPEAFCYHAI